MTVIVASRVMRTGGDEGQAPTLTGLAFMAFRALEQDAVHHPRGRVDTLRKKRRSNFPLYHFSMFYPLATAPRRQVA